MGVIWVGGRDLEVEGMERGRGLWDDKGVCSINFVQNIDK
jgi:hypothetical protein